MHKNILYFRSPASLWEEALPLGNGKTGAMVFGGTEKDKISLNYDELWTGFPRNENKKGAYRIYHQAKEAALAGNLSQAQDILEKDFPAPNVQAYMPAGDLILQKQPGRIRGYSRILDIDNACAVVSYSKDGVGCRWEYFTSAPDGVLVIRAGAKEQKQISFALKLRSSLKCEYGFAGGMYYMDGECPFDSPSNRKAYPERNKLYSDQEQERGIRYRIAVRVLNRGGLCSVTEKGIDVKDADSVVIVLAIESSFNGFRRHPFTDGKEFRSACLARVQSACEKGYEELRKRHLRHYHSYYDRVSFSLEGNSYEQIPTNERLIRFAKDRSDAGLYELLFHYGRYLTISASEPDSQAMNLQGIWNAKIEPPWNSNYTVNINTEMNYFPTLMCDLPEMHLPFIRMISEIAENGEETAKEYYQAEGFCCHHNSDIWRSCTPVPGNAQWMFWPMAGGWFCHHLYEHYQYTMDQEFLQNTAFPIMCKAAQFYLDVLTPDEDGYLIFAPSTSPENSRAL